MFFEAHFRNISLRSPSSCQVLEVAFGKVNDFSSLTVVIIPYLSTAVAKVLEVAVCFRIIPLALSFTIVIFPMKSRQLHMC